jgi:hypothetical protein
MNNTFEGGPDASADVIASTPPLAFDADKYAPYVADFDMSEEQKQELLETLWSIMQTFVNLGLDISKADLCGQLFADFNEACEGAPDGVESNHPSIQETASISGKDRP